MDYCRIVLPLEARALIFKSRFQIKDFLGNLKHLLGKRGFLGKAGAYVYRVNTVYLINTSLSSAGISIFPFQNAFLTFYG